MQVTTNSNGSYSISGVPNGIYNLVISKGKDKTITKIINVSGRNIENDSVTLPSQNKNSIVEVKKGTPNIVVDKLNDYFSSKKITDDDKTF